jgi:arylsulfatase
MKAWRLAWGAACVLLASATGAERPPNLVLLFADDLGWADLSVQGAPYPTPRLDRMAAEGTRFTSFYVAQAVCTASRAALMTGCLPNRVGLEGALNHTSRNGIHPDELLLPELLRARGYATGIFGKWHLGTKPAFHPLRHGFDEFVGLPYSNDNSKYHPVLAAEMPPLPWYEGETVTETDPDQSRFTRRLTDAAVSFLKRHRDRPFFLYVPHVMPHVPIFVSEEGRGRTGAGLYADVVAELDDSVGRILDTIRELGLEDDTWVVFFSDNGPFLSYGNHAGRATPLREGKLTSFEGGVRVPCLMRWPGTIPAGRVCDEPLMAVDFLPTLARWVGATLPERKIDGRDIREVVTGQPGARSPHDALVFYAGRELQAVRSGNWKLHFPHPYLTVTGEPGRDGKPSRVPGGKPMSITQSGIEGIASRHGYGVGHLELSLFDLANDPGETTNLAARHPDVVARLQALAEPIRAELGDSLTGTAGSAVRPAGLAAE